MTSIESDWNTTYTCIYLHLLALHSITFSIWQTFQLRCSVAPISGNMPSIWQDWSMISMQGPSWDIALKATIPAKHHQTDQTSYRSYLSVPDRPSHWSFWFSVAFWWICDNYYNWVIIQMYFVIHLFCSPEWIWDSLINQDMHAGILRDGQGACLLPEALPGNGLTGWMVFKGYTTVIACD